MTFSLFLENKKLHAKGLQQTGDKLDSPYKKNVINKMLATIRHLFMNAEEGESISFISSAIAPTVRSWSEERQLLFFSLALKHFTATKQMFDTHRQLMTNGLTSHDSKLRYLAFKCWALCSVSIEPLAEQSSTKLFLLALEREGEEKIQRIIFQALFDSILLFELPSSGQLFNSLSDHFLNKAVSYSVKTRKLLILGFCKCYASGKYQDSLILGQLILKCSSELFEPEKSIRDLIRRFFDWYVGEKILSVAVIANRYISNSCASSEINILFDDSFKRVIVTLLSSRTNIEPLLIFYKRMTLDAKRLRQMAFFLIQQLVKFTSASLTKNTLDCVQNWTDKDEMIANCTNILDKIQNAQIMRTLTEFIASLNNTNTGKAKRKRKLGGEQLDHSDQLRLSTIISSGLPNKKHKFDNQ